MRINRTASIFATISLVATALFATTSATAAPASLPASANKAAFWTADKINKAIAFDMVFQKGAKVATRVPVARGVSKPSGTTTTSVLGTSWTKGGLPLTASGKVFFAVGASYYQCSGALLADGLADRSIVLTAGHCVFDNATSSYVSNWIFIPSYDVNIVAISGCSTSTNCWAASSILANDNFTSQTGFTTQATLYDWGFATIKVKNSSGLLPDGGNGTTDGTNSFPISLTTLALSTPVSAFGYPAAGKYQGNDLVYSSAKISFDVNNGNNTYSLASDMTGGASGGPWLSAFSTTAPYGGTLSSVNSYKYGTTTYMYGPKFNAQTAANLLTAKQI